MSSDFTPEQMAIIDEKLAEAKAKLAELRAAEMRLAKREMEQPPRFVGNRHERRRAVALWRAKKKLEAKGLKDGRSQD